MQGSLYSSHIGGFSATLSILLVGRCNYPTNQILQIRFAASFLIWGLSIHLHLRISLSPLRYLVMVYRIKHLSSNLKVPAVNDEIKCLKGTIQGKMK